jgi:uncharacterized damage-inducible protein DinB
MPNSTQISHVQINMLCWLIENAYNSDDPQSLLANLKNLRQEDWHALPPTGGRSIADILEHIGWCKWMYEDYAFGNANLRGDRPPMVPAGGTRSRPTDELVEWVNLGQAKWLASVRNLPDDSELERQRLTNWGEYLSTRDIVQIMIAHDYYHAGEINHLRALLQGNDFWEYE